MMDNKLEFREFEMMNSGNADKYVSVKELNEQIHKTIENKKVKWIYTEKDMERKSEKYIVNNIYDIGRGKFMSLGSLNRELNKMGKF